VQDQNRDGMSLYQETLYGQGAVFSANRDKLSAGQKDVERKIDSMSKGRCVFLLLRARRDAGLLSQMSQGWNAGPTSKRVVLQPCVRRWDNCLLQAPDL